jgi:exodeoxyribonuclease VII small subunit
MTAKKAESGAKTVQDLGFEKALERLEDLVAQMESGSLSLEDMIARFEEGQSLVKLCAKRLNEVERKIEVLVKRGDGVAAEPFEAEPDSEEDEADTEASTPHGEGQLF